MGMNHYAQIDRCGSCNRFDQYHIGRSSRMFRGHLSDYFGEFTPLLKFAPDHKIVRWQDWKRVLTDTPGLMIVSEDGESILVADYIRQVEATPKPERGRQMRYLRERGLSEHRDWLDSEGFDFHDGEFS